MRRIVIAACAALCGGCAFFEPSTELIGPGFRWTDSKDTDVEITDLEVDPATKHVRVAKIVIRNNASDVALANAQQMLAASEQIRVSWEGLAHVTEQLARMVPGLLSAASGVPVPAVAPPTQPAVP